MELWGVYSTHKTNVPATTNVKVPPDLIHFKTMERFMDFLVYVARTYITFVWYLKGVYLILNSWSPERTADGWPLPGFKRNL